MHVRVDTIREHLPGSMQGPRRATAQARTCKTTAITELRAFVAAHGQAGKGHGTLQERSAMSPNNGAAASVTRHRPEQGLMPMLVQHAAPTSVDEDITGLEVTVHDGGVSLLHRLHAPRHIQGHLQARCQGPPRCRPAASVAVSSRDKSY